MTSRIGGLLDTLVPGLVISEHNRTESILIREVPRHVTVVLGSIIDDVDSKCYVSADKSRIEDEDGVDVDCFNDTCDKCHSKDTMLGADIKCSLGCFKNLFFTGSGTKFDSGFVEQYMNEKKVRLGFISANKEYTETFSVVIDVACPSARSGSLEQFRKVHFRITRITFGESRGGLNNSPLLN